MLERAPLDESGGNSRFTAGAFRCAYSGVEDLRELMPDLSDDEVAVTDDGKNVTGVVVRRGGERPETMPADAVVLACGGFEANPEWRTRYLGPGWELARVRGTRFNTGDGIRMALDLGAAAYGN